MAGSDLDYGYRPPDAFRPNDPWDEQYQGWSKKTDLYITGPHGSDIEYGFGVTGIVNVEEERQQYLRQQEGGGGGGGGGGGEAREETLIRYYVPPKVPHPPARQHKDEPRATTLLKKTADAEQASEKSALQELIDNPRWQVVRAGDPWKVVRPKGEDGPDPDPLDIAPRIQGVLVIVEPKKTGNAQRFVKDLRRRGHQQTCICLVEKSPSCKDPVAVSTMSNALLASGANEVLMDGWLSYYVNGMSVGGYKASLTAKGMEANPAAGDVSFQAGMGGGTNFYGRTGMVSIG